MLEGMISIIIIFVVGYLSAEVTLRLKIPLARLIGPIFAIGSLKMLGFNIIAPGYLQAVVSIVLGSYFGVFFNKKVIKEMRDLIKPCIFLILANILMTVFNGYLLTNTTLIDKATALFAVVPGGIAEMTIIALSYQADIVQVTSFQIARLLAVVLIMPPLIIRVFSKSINKNMLASKQIPKKQNSLNPEKMGTDRDINMHWSFAYLVGATGGIIFFLLKFPASFLIGALVAIVLFNLLKKETLKIAAPPMGFSQLAQIIMGGIIGVSFSQDSLYSIGMLFLPIMVMTFLTIMGSVLIAWFISKIFKIDFLTSILASVPGGLLPMIIMAEELKTDVTIVSTLQTVRLMTAILIIPLVYGFLI